MADVYSGPAMEPWEEWLLFSEQWTVPHMGTTLLHLATEQQDAGQPEDPPAVRVA
jgi:hypothetical protein